MKLVFSTINNVKETTPDFDPLAAIPVFGKRTHKGVEFIDEKEFETLSLSLELRDYLKDEIWNYNNDRDIIPETIESSLYISTNSTRLYTILHIPFFITWVNMELKVKKLPPPFKHDLEKEKKSYLEIIEKVFGTDLFNKMTDYATAMIEKDIGLITDETLKQKRNSVIEEYKEFKKQDKIVPKKNDDDDNDFVDDLLDLMDESRESGNTVFGTNQVVVPLNNDLEIVLNLKIQKIQKKIE